MRLVVVHSLEVPEPADSIQVLAVGQEREPADNRRALVAALAPVDNRPVVAAAYWALFFAADKSVLGQAHNRAVLVAAEVGLEQQFAVQALAVVVDNRRVIVVALVVARGQEQVEQRVALADRALCVPPPADYPLVWVFHGLARQPSNRAQTYNR